MSTETQGGGLRLTAEGKAELLALGAVVIPDVEVELRERMELIERFAHVFADPDCDNCEGDGIDTEGAEWSLCDCSQAQLRETEATYRRRPDDA